MDTSMLQQGIFRNPRPKKSILPPPSKKRKVEHKIEEISFDDNSREDYLTGFHKRKVQRIKRAQEENEKKAKEERRQLRKQLREERKEELEEHVEAINRALRQVDDSTSPDQEAGTWDGFEDDGSNPILPPIDQHEEYVDEDKYITVTVEEVNVSKEGLQKYTNEPEEGVETDERTNALPIDKASTKKKWPKKEKPKKFRYESKAERRITRGKQKMGSKARADARRDR